MDNIGTAPLTEEIPNNNETSDLGQAQIKIEDYKSLQSEYTKSRQELIRSRLELAKTKPESILDISDVKLQNSVVKEMYGLNNIKEVQVIYGEKFYETSDDEDGADEIKILKKELNLLKFQSSQSAVENAIKEFKVNNSQIFKDDSEAEERLREKLSTISQDVPLEERVKYAGMIAFGSNYVSSTKAAYKDLSTSIPSSIQGDKKTEEIVDNKKTNEDALRNFFKI